MGLYPVQVYMDYSRLANHRTHEIEILLCNFTETCKLQNLERLIIAMLRLTSESRTLKDFSLQISFHFKANNSKILTKKIVGPSLHNAWCLCVILIRLQVYKMQSLLNVRILCAEWQSECSVIGTVPY